MAVETRHWVADVLEDSIWQQKRKNGEDPGAYDTTIADRSAARERIADTETTDGFVEETDFDRSYVVIAQNVMQSARWLELGWIERNEDAISMAVTTEEPDGLYGDDAAAHTLAVRIPDEKADVPDTTSVVID